MQSAKLCRRTRANNYAGLPETETVLKLAKSWANWGEVVTLRRTVSTNLV